MRVHGLTVSVNFSDHLAKGIGRWMDGLSSLTVVSDPEDIGTESVVENCPGQTTLLKTRVFYADGAAFNKGAALEEGRRAMPFEDWILVFDSDIVPPVGWKEKVEENDIEPGWLYGAIRKQWHEKNRLSIDDPKLPIVRGDGVGVGFFQLFHSGDPAVQTSLGQTLFETCWSHAGNYDNDLMNRWRNRGRRPRLLDGFTVTHVGRGKDWLGRGKTAKFEEMMGERKRRGGKWDHERIRRQ